MLPTLLPLLLAALAGLVRGFSGFGYAVIMGLGLAWVLPRSQAVATALLLDLVCVLGVLPWAWRHRDPALLAPLLLGMVLSSPASVWLLQALPASGLHLMAGVIALLGGLMLLTRWQLPGGMPRLALPVGSASGLAMTCASAGGPPLMYYLLNQPCRPGDPAGHRHPFRPAAACSHCWHSGAGICSGGVADPGRPAVAAFAAGGQGRRLAVSPPWHH